MGSGLGPFNSLVVSTEDPFDDVGARSVECGSIGIDPFNEVVVDPNVGVELLHGVVLGVVLAHPWAGVIRTVTSRPLFHAGAWG